MVSTFYFSYDEEGHTFYEGVKSLIYNTPRIEDCYVFIGDTTKEKIEEDEEAHDDNYRGEGVIEYLAKKETDAHKQKGMKEAYKKVNKKQSVKIKELKAENKKLEEENNKIKKEVEAYENTEYHDIQTITKLKEENKMSEEREETLEKLRDGAMKICKNTANDWKEEQEKNKKLKEENIILKEVNNTIQEDLDEWVKIDGLMNDLFYDGYITTKLLCGIHSEVDSVVKGITELKDKIDKLKEENKQCNKIIRQAKRDRGYSVTDSEEEDSDSE